MSIPVEIGGRLLVGAVLALAVGGCSCGLPENPQAIRRDNLAQDLARARQTAPALAGAVGLKQAVDYALANNLQLWLARQERAIRLERQSSATLKMLPSLRANAEYSRRDKYSASTSVNLFTGEQSLSTSYSSEKTRQTFDLAATWNLLDFGVTYLRARQEADRVIMVEQDLRRTRQRVAMDVTEAYWQAITARRLAEQAAEIQSEIETQLAAIRNQQSMNNISESAAIQAELPLLRQLHRMKIYRRDHQTAIQNLANLMGVPVGAHLELADPGELPAIDAGLLADLERLEQTALLNRPELFQDDMRERISQRDARIALIEMFPSPALFARYSHDDNKYLYYNDWHTVGVTAAWDIFAIPSKVAGRRASLLESEFAQKRRLATTIAILTQVHIAAIEYQNALAQMEDVRQIDAKSARLVDVSTKAAEDGKAHAGQTLALKTQRMQDLEAYLRGYVQLMSARARLFNSIGVDPADDGTLALPMIDPEEKVQPAPVTAQIGEAAKTKCLIGKPIESADDNSAESVVGSWHFGDGQTTYTHTYRADGTFDSDERHRDYRRGTWACRGAALIITFNSGREFRAIRLGMDTFDWGPVYGLSRRVKELSAASSDG